MKKIFAFILSAGLIAAIGTISNSCAPTGPMEHDTTFATLTQSNLNLTRKDSSQEVGISLPCGCAFGPLVITKYSGDTNVIHFTFMEPPTSTVSTHTVYASMQPTILNSSGKDSAWMAIFFQNSSGGNSYDTIRAYATY